MKGSAFKEMIEFHFLQAAWSTKAFLVTCGHVTGSRFALSFRFGAFKNDDLAWHVIFGGGAIWIYSSSSSRETVTDSSSSCGIPPLKPTSSEGRNLRLPYSFSH